MPVLSQHLLWSKTPLARVGAPPSEPTSKQSLALSPRSLSISRASLCSLPQAFVASVPKGGIREGISEEVLELQPKSMSLMSFCPVQSLGNIRAQISHTRQAWRGQAFGKARLNVLCDGNEKFPNSLRVQHRGPHHTSTLTVVTEQRDNRALRVLLKLVMLRGQKLHLHCIEKGAWKSNDQCWSLQGSSKAQPLKPNKVRWNAEEIQLEPSSISGTASTERGCNVACVTKMVRKINVQVWCFEDQLRGQRFAVSWWRGQTRPVWGTALESIFKWAVRDYPEGFRDADWRRSQFPQHWGCVLTSAWLCVMLTASGMTTASVVPCPAHRSALVLWCLNHMPETAPPGFSSPSFSGRLAAGQGCSVTWNTSPYPALHPHLREQSPAPHCATCVPFRRYLCAQLHPSWSGGILH